MTYYFKKPFGQNGDITQIPVNDQNDGRVSYEKGWPENYELDPNTDPEEARNLSRTNFNGLFYNITEALQTLQQYGCNPYITSTDNGGEPFPYPEGGMCYYVDPVTNDFGVYYSLRSNNIDVPSENGITTKFWQRIFNKEWDVLKSNRVSNAPLYFVAEPTYSMASNILTFTIPQGSKFLFANGYNSDNTLKSNIVFIANDATVTLDTTGLLGNTYYLFITSDESATLLTDVQYSVYETEENVIVDKGTTSDVDVYYFNRDLNKWKKRIANTTEFVDIDYSLCLIATAQVAEGVVYSFEILKTLQLVTRKEFESLLTGKQNTLIAGSHISLSPATLDTTVISANVPSTVTPFAVNSCNLDANGDIDLLTTDSQTFTTVITPLIAAYGSNLTITYSGIPYTYSSANNMFGSTGNSFSFSTPREAVCKIDASFSTSQNINNGYFTFSIYASTTTSEVNQFSRYNLKILISFDDGSTYDSGYLISIHSYFQQISRNFSIPIPSQYNNKKITHITIDFDARGPARISNSAVQHYFSNIQIYTSETVTSYIGHDLIFKTGSNYLDLLNNTSNATPLITRTNGAMDATYPELNSIWAQEGVMCQFAEWWNEFDATYEFTEATAATNNAKLFIRYNDLDSDNMMNDFSVMLTYADNSTYYLMEHAAIPRTKDLLLNVPNNKSIKKITISARYMNFLGKSSLGLVQLYNGVSDQLVFTQYPAIYATSADGSKNFMLNNVAPINLTQSGYVMINEAGAYILPGTNVIRKQRTEPTIHDDPALADGDIWLDLGSEPLCAYKRINGQWNICYDVPVGYVTVSQDSSGYVIDSLEQYPVNQNGYNINAFTETIASLSGRDGRDGQNGRDGINGAPGEKGDPGIGIPSGGLQGQVLAKLTNESYNCTWTSMASTALFDGGQAGQTLIKNSSDNLDFSWQTIQALPSGGNVGDALVRSSGDSATWTPIKGVPSGGSTSQALVKLSNADYDYGWQDAGGGNPLVVLGKTNFKLDTYISANANGYTGIVYEQFADTTGINSTADDGATVISTYWSQTDLNVNNTSNGTLTFRLKEITTTSPISFINVTAEATGTIAYSISTDGGTSFSSITLDTVTSLNTTSLILKIQMSSLATISNIAIETK